MTGSNRTSEQWVDRDAVEASPSAGWRATYAVMATATAMDADLSGTPSNYVRNTDE